MPFRPFRLWKKYNIIDDCGVRAANEGEIYFDGQPMSEVEAEQRDIGMVFQNYALYPHMTVSENIQFPLKMKWMKKKERIQKVEKIAELIQMRYLLKRKPSQLSGGQQGRKFCDCESLDQGTENLAFG